ncbi:MAG: O-antigen ligase family protein, partial [bacterium]|nr:O-antigen ligase family protein [bacterium]
RGDGLLTLTVITTFFYLILLSADREFFGRFVKVVSVVAGIIAAIAVLQWIETLFSARVSFLPPISGRIGSTFGNAAFLAGYLSMTLFVIFIAFRDSVGVWRHIFKTAAILSVLAILFAATRGSILALVCAGGVALIFAVWKGNESIKHNARYGLLALVILAGLFFVFRSNLAQSSFEPVRRIASISLSDSTVASRLFVWQHIGAEALQRPFLGYGAEHIAQLFDKVYDPSKIVEQWFDRSHNSFLDYFAQYGVFGLALYLALIGAFIMYAIKLYRREAPGLMNSGFFFLLLILTYAVQNFFVFDTPSSLWLFYTLFAFLIVAVSDVPATELSPRHLPPIASGTVSALIALLIVPAVFIPLYANILLTQGYLYHLIDVNRANAYFKQGLALGAYADMEYGYQAYEMYTGHQAVQLTGQERVVAYQFALSLLTTNFEKYPYDARTATYLGHVIDTAPPEVTVDDTFDQHVLSQAIELSPLRAQPWYMMANISLRKADYQEAIRVLEAYAQKEPTLPVPRFILATLYYKLGDQAVAKKWADEALPLYIAFDTAAAEPAVKYYIAISDWQHAVRFLADVVANNPVDYNALYDLAKVTYLAGDPATAERIVEQLRRD